MRDAVKRYIGMGLRPIPVFGVLPDGSCQCGRATIGPAEHGKIGSGVGKHPIDPDWKDRKPFMPDEFPDGCSVALGMGKQMDGRWLVALDFDGDVPVEDWLGELPETLLAITGRGHHRIFSVPPFTPLGNWRDAWFTRDEIMGYKPGFSGALDVRFARGAIVAPPSKHRNGAVYQWFAADAPIAELPREALGRILTRRRQRGLPVESFWSRKGKRP